MLKNINESSDRVKELANTYVTSGEYQCAESIVRSFSEALDFPADLRYVTGFGGGLGNTHCVCGAYNGSVVVLNLLYGKDKRNGHDDKLILGTSETLDHAIHKLDKAFKDVFKTTCCKILTRNVEWASPEHGAHCANLTTQTAEILWSLLQELESEKVSV